jgi:hypothetical protein
VCCHILLRIGEGHLSTFRIKSDGAVTEVFEGTVVNGKFHDLGENDEKKKYGTNN